jgi:ATP-dependent Zn protease
MGTELQSKQLPADDYSMSDATRRMVDEEQQYMTDLAHRRALRILSEQRTLLEALAASLLEHEVLERDEIERLVALHAGAHEGRPLERREEPGAALIAASERLQPPS